MLLILWLTIIVLVVLILLFPPILILYGIIAVYPISLLIIHGRGQFVPHWTFGEDPSSSVVIYYRTKHKIQIELQFKVIDNMDDTFMTIREAPVVINNSSPSQIRFDKNSENPGYFHYFLVTHLIPNTTYEYRFNEINQNNSITNKNRSLFSSKNCIFYTLSAQSEGNLLPSTQLPFKFAVFGDIQVGETLEIIKAFLLYRIRQNHPNLIISLGDNVHRYDDMHAWLVWHSLLRKLIPKIPLYTTPGNHDFGSDYGKTMALDAMMLPITTTSAWYYSFIMNRILFISINSRTLFDSEYQSVQMEWLEKELKNSVSLKNDKIIDWTIIFTHTPWWGPRYSIQNSNEREEQYMKDNWVPLFEKYGVDLCFAGHKHSYCREESKFITGSMHGVRTYPEEGIANKDEYVLRNQHHFCILEYNSATLAVHVKDWRNKNIETYVLKATDHKQQV